MSPDWSAKEEPVPGHVIRLDGDLRAAFADVLLKPGDGPLSDRHIAVLLALAVNEDQPTVEMKIVELELDHLQPADAAGVQHLQDRAVAQADGIGHVAELA